MVIRYSYWTQIIIVSRFIFDSFIRKLVFSYTWHKIKTVPSRHCLQIQKQMKIENQANILYWCEFYIESKREKMSKNILRFERKKTKPKQNNKPNKSTSFHTNALFVGRNRIGDNAIDSVIPNANGIFFSFMFFCPSLSMVLCIQFIFLVIRTQFRISLHF